MTRTSARGPQTISALVSVTSVEDLSPTFRRVRMAGADLLGASPALIGEGPEITCADAYLKLLIPPPGREAEHPDLVTSRMTKALRPGKVFLDWSQNNGKKTTISPYSLRGKARPTVAAPRTWEMTVTALRTRSSRPISCSCTIICCAERTWSYDQRRGITSTSAVSAAAKR